MKLLVVIILILGTKVHAALFLCENLFVDSNLVSLKTQLGGRTILNKVKAQTSLFLALNDFIAGNEVSLEAVQELVEVAFSNNKMASNATPMIKAKLLHWFLRRITSISDPNIKKNYLEKWVQFASKIVSENR